MWTPYRSLLCWTVRTRPPMDVLAWTLAFCWPAIRLASIAWKPGSWLLRKRLLTRPPMVELVAVAACSLMAFRCEPIVLWSRTRHRGRLIVAILASQLLFYDVATFELMSGYRCRR